MTRSNWPSQMTCPHCGQGFAMTPDLWPQYQGRSIPCTRCGKQFVASTSPAKTAPTPPPLPAAAAGAIPPIAYPPAGNPQSYTLPSQRGMSGGKIVLIIACCVVPVLVIMFLISILLPVLNHARTEAQKAKCAANLTQIYAACVTYAHQNNGDLPDSFAILLRTTSYPPDLLICPADNATKSTVNVNNLTDADLNGHCSYIYTGAGLNLHKFTTSVIAYEPLSDHHRGANFLHADGSVQWLSTANADALIRQLTRDHPPARFPPPSR